LHESLQLSFLGEIFFEDEANCDLSEQRHLLIWPSAAAGTTGQTASLHALNFDRCCLTGNNVYVITVG